MCIIVSRREHFMIFVKQRGWSLLPSPVIRMKPRYSVISDCILNSVRTLNVRSCESEKEDRGGKERKQEEEDYGTEGGGVKGMMNERIRRKVRTRVL
jgi:hypothetical protein